MMARVFELQSASMALVELELLLGSLMESWPSLYWCDMVVASSLPMHRTP